MHALDVLGDPVRRRILELLATGERPSGGIGEVVQQEFGISQPAVSQHLRVLREAGFTSVRPDGARRLYALRPEPLAAADAWFDPFRRFWAPHLDALGTELARGRRQARLAGQSETGQRTTGRDGTGQDETPQSGTRQSGPSRSPTTGSAAGQVQASGDGSQDSRSSDDKSTDKDGYHGSNHANDEDKEH
jgi:DNA-binding transcriptional ArsR family regulator